MRSSTLIKLNAARREGRVLVRAVDLSSFEERLIDPHSTGASPLQVACRMAARADASGRVEIEGRPWFLWTVSPPLELVIVGAAHIAQHLAAMAGRADYDVRIIDPRAAFATRERFPETEVYCCWPDEAFEGKPLGARSALIALSHDPKIDDPALIGALKSKCFYVGALGSARTHAARKARLEQLGLGDEELRRIHAPIGLKIGAKTTFEIAVAIMAEVTQTLRLAGADAALGDA
jgi:xanthine dehydrogenase accessory factor